MICLFVNILSFIYFRIADEAFLYKHHLLEQHSEKSSYKKIKTKLTKSENWFIHKMSHRPE